jgi:hypothetical protein
VWGGLDAHPLILYTVITITYEVAVYAPAERAETLPLFLIYPYFLCDMLYVIWIVWKVVNLGIFFLFNIGFWGVALQHYYRK